MKGQIAYNIFSSDLLDSMLFQMDGPVYSMVTKKEKAYAMDVNSVLWNPKASFPSLLQNSSTCNKFVLRLYMFGVPNSQNPCILTSASDDGTIKPWEVAEISG